MEIKLLYSIKETRGLLLIITGLECIAADDHFAAVAGGIEACTEDGTVPQVIRQCKLSATAALALV